MDLFLERYKQGQHREVWSELLNFGEKIRFEPLYSEAFAVAQETMSRVNFNLQQIVERLNNIGYKFNHSIMGDKFDHLPITQVSSKQNNDSIIQAVENHINGSLPLSLKAFYEVFNEIDLRGSHPDYTFFEREHTDALVVYPLPLSKDFKSGILDQIESWEEIDEDYEYWDEPRDENKLPYLLWVSPDCYHKVDVSGGPPYGVLIPDNLVDTKLLGVTKLPYFVDYLRDCLKWGGFPGFKYNQDETLEIVSMLTKDLLNF